MAVISSDNTNNDLVGTNFVTVSSVSPGVFARRGPGVDTMFGGLRKRRLHRRQRERGRH